MGFELHHTKNSTLIYPYFWDQFKETYIQITGNEVVLYIKNIRKVCDFKLDTNNLKLNDIEELIRKYLS